MKATELTSMHWNDLLERVTANYLPSMEIENVFVNHKCFWDTIISFKI